MTAPNPSAANFRAVGANAESLGAEWLQAQGVTLIARNFHWRGGEIDIIAEYEGWLIFIEVKYRRSRRNGWPAAAVTRSKQASIVRTAQIWLQRHGGINQRIRFDVLSMYQPIVEQEPVIKWIKGAFRPDGGNV